MLEYVDGRTLGEIIHARRKRGAGFSEDEIREIMRALLNALSHIHRKGCFLYSTDAWAYILICQWARLQSFEKRARSSVRAVRQI